jgi:hypothetical protein
MKSLIKILHVALYLAFAANFVFGDRHSALYYFMVNTLILLIISHFNLFQSKYLYYFGARDKKIFDRINIASLVLFVLYVVGMAVWGYYNTIVLFFGLCHCVLLCVFYIKRIISAPLKKTV